MAKPGIFISVEFLHTANIKLLGVGEEYHSRNELYGLNIIPAVSWQHGSVVFILL
jgi:hypothetical protein